MSMINDFIRHAYAFESTNEDITDTTDTDVDVKDTEECGDGCGEGNIFDSILGPTEPEVPVATGNPFDTTGVGAECGGNCGPALEDDEDDDDDDETPYVGDDEDFPSDADIDEFDALTGDVDEVEDLDPEEEQEADRYMSIVGTQALIDSELNNDEKVEFAESMSDVRIAVNEGFMTEAQSDEFLNRYNSFYATEAKYTKPTLIRLGKQDKLKQLYSIAVFACARAKNDPDMKKLEILNAKRRVLKARLYKKYDSQAKMRMKIYFKRLNASQSKPIKQLVSKVAPN